MPLTTTSLWCFPAFAVLASLPACGEGHLSYLREGELSATFAVEAGTRAVRVEIPLGSIKVEAGEPGRIEFRGLFRRASDTAEGLARLEELDFTLTRVMSDEPGVIALSAPNLPEGLDSITHALILRTHLRVPVDLAVELIAGRGELTVVERRGPVRVRTGSGDVRLSQVHADAEVVTGHGHCFVEGHRGGLDVRTKFGTILAFLDGLGAAGVRLTTEEPSIQCHLPRGAGFELEAEVALGEAVNTFDLPIEPLGESGQQFRGSVGGGGPTVRLECGRGYVTATVRKSR